jgi:putative uncharacterized protein (fragment)
VFDVVLPPPPQPKDLRHQWLYVLCSWWKEAKNLYSGKYHRAGYNLQILTDQAGEIFYISKITTRIIHDITAVRNTGLFGYTQPRHHAAERLRWLRMRHDLQKKTRETLTGVAETIQ